MGSFIISLHELSDYAIAVVLFSLTSKLLHLSSLSTVACMRYSKNFRLDVFLV